MLIETIYSHYLPEASLGAARSAIAAAIGETAGLRAMSDEDAARPTAAGKWSRKEILGHLVDSALNNTQRFVRAAIPAHLDGGALRLPGYEQNAWVRVAAYQQRPWPEIIDLWVGLNRHIVHIIDHFDPAALTVRCTVGDEDAAPIEHLMIDYAGHLVHHHRQLAL
jgi:hypothetical protein